MERDWQNGTRWRHVKTGDIYLTVGKCRLEKTGEPAVLYQLACTDGKDGTVWARASDEFLDGRFERLPSFPLECTTDEQPPRKIRLLGTSAIDPDVWVAEIEGESRPAWVVKSSGGICHPTTDVMKHHVVKCPAC